MPGLTARDRFQIPDVIDPPDTLCLTMTIPNDPTHIANLLGAIYQIAFGPNYQNDDAHSAKELVQVWRRYYNTIQIDDCPVPMPPIMIDESEYLMSICEQLRYHNGRLQGFCCGEWVDIMGQPSQGAGGPSQPGGGSPQPPPGGCQEWSGSFLSGDSWLVPTVVSAGDVLSITAYDGATTDVAPLGRWNCPDGFEFFLGNCNANTQLDPTAPIPSLPIGHLIFNLGGTYYDGLLPLTIPGGVSNEIVAIELNYAAGGSYGGSVNFTVNRCNNQPGNFVHNYDFRLTPGLFVPDTIGGSPSALWVAGTGWVSQDTVNLGKNVRAVSGALVFSSRDITNVGATVTYTPGDLSGFTSADTIDFFTGSHDYIIYPLGTEPSGTDIGLAQQPGSATGTDIQVRLFSDETVGAPTGTSILVGMTISGVGTDPFA